LAGDLADLPVGARSAVLPERRDAGAFLEKGVEELVDLSHGKDQCG
jgi:hypothetical protein